MSQQEIFTNTSSENERRRKLERIRALNDHLRHTLNGGRVVMTKGILALNTKEFVYAVTRVSDFVEFNEDNDPYHEHDFGAFEVEGIKIFWKIDYYAKGDECHGSPDPSDPKVTDRVLTIFLASEY